MGKRSATNGIASHSAQPTQKTSLISTKKKHVDPLLSSLFESSAGPIAVVKPSLPKQSSSRKIQNEIRRSSDTSEPDTNHGHESPDIKMSDAEDTAEPSVAIKARSGKKRKRAEAQDDLEARYMERLVDEQSQSENEAEQGAAQVEEDDEESSEAGSEAEDNGPIPQHESLNKNNEDPEVEKASRTVFLANVSTQAVLSKPAKKTLLHHLASFFPSLSKEAGPHKVESIRFRSTAYAVKLPKKASFIRKELMDATTKSTNAYAVYSSKLAAREAVKHLNGTIVLDRHLRVDQVAHPAKTDHRRCVFVGNLDFVDDENAPKDDSDKPADDDEKPKKSKKNRPPADVEEGLWQHFSKAGTVESVRVIRDAQTRIGKGFAYVQFVDENSVEAALLYNDKKFPPLLPRTLRVTRAKAFKRNANRGGPNDRRPAVQPGGDRSMQGRAGKLLGRAGAAQMRQPERWTTKRQNTADHSSSVARDTADGNMIFEGHRAQKKDGNKVLKFNTKQQKSKLRAAAWRRNKNSS